MKKYLLIILILLLSKSKSFSQTELAIGWNFGLGSYEMTLLKELNGYINDVIPYESEIVSDFPAYLYYGPDIKFKIGRSNIGSSPRIYSTGSRVSSADYSGEYRYDNLIKSLALNVYFGYDFIKIERSSLALYAKLGLSLSTLELTEYTEINQEVLLNENMKFNSQSLYVEPCLSYTYNLGKISIQSSLGYSFHILNSPFYYQEYNEYTLRRPMNNGNIKPSWNGIRVEFGFHYNIKL